MKIKVCKWKMCKSRFSEYIIKRLENDIAFHNYSWVILEETPCMWHCDEWPNAQFDRHLEHDMNPFKASKMMMDKKKCQDNNKKNSK